MVKRNYEVSSKISELNDVLNVLCMENGFLFLSNSNIGTNLLSHDGIHISTLGTNVFAGNIVDYINNFILIRSVNED